MRTDVALLLQLGADRIHLGLRLGSPRLVRRFPVVRGKSSERASISSRAALRSLAFSAPSIMISIRQTPRQKASKLFGALKCVDSLADDFT
jgi:hypothetical protein